MICHPLCYFLFISCGYYPCLISLFWSLCVFSFWAGSHLTIKFYRGRGAWWQAASELVFCIRGLLHRDTSPSLPCGQPCISFTKGVPERWGTARRCGEHGHEHKRKDMCIQAWMYYMCRDNRSSEDDWPGWFWLVAKRKDTNGVDFDLRGRGSEKQPSSGRAWEFFAYCFTC